AAARRGLGVPRRLGRAHRGLPRARAAPEARRRCGAHGARRRLRRRGRTRGHGVNPLHDVRATDVRRPLDPLPSIKLKLGFVIAAAVAVTIFVFWVGIKIGIWPSVSGLLPGLVAMSLLWWLSRGMTSPLREMGTAADAMARGDYSRRVTTTSHDEVGALAHAFNDMAAELAQTDRMRRDLIANVSHELRTPITALQAQLENLADGVAEPDPETLQTMVRQVERLGRLVAQLLELSGLQNRP